MMVLIRIVTLIMEAPQRYLASSFICGHSKKMPLLRKLDLAKC